MNIAADKAADGEAPTVREIMKELIAEDRDLRGVFASDPIAAEAVAQAVAEKHTDDLINIVAVGSSESLVKLLQSDAIAGIVVEDPFRMGYDGVKTALAASKGEPVPANVDTAPRLVDAAEVCERGASVAARGVVGGRLGEDATGEAYSLLEMASEKMRVRQAEHRKVTLGIDGTKTPRLLELLDGAQAVTEITEHPAAERADVHRIWMQGERPVGQFQRLLVADPECRISPGRHGENGRVLRIAATARPTRSQASVVLFCLSSTQPFTFIRTRHSASAASASA